MKTRVLFLLPVIVALISLIIVPKLSFLIVLIILISLGCYLSKESIKITAIIPIRVPCEPLSTMEELSFSSQPIEKKIIPCEALPICPMAPCKVSNLDFSIRLNTPQVPKYKSLKIQDISIPYSQNQPRKNKIITSDYFEQSYSSQQEHQKKHLKDSEKFLTLSPSYPNDLFNQKFIPRIESLHEEIFTYYSQLNYHEEEVAKQPKIPGARVRFLIEPAEANYQALINEKIELYKTSLEVSKKSINPNLKIELESISSQITSDVKDLEHLNSRISAALSLLQGLKDEELNSAIYILCESVVSRGAGQADSIDAGPNFALNFTNYVLSIAKSYPIIHEIYFLAVVKIKHSYYPVVKEEEIETIMKRSELKDFNPDGRLGESEKEKFKMQMDRARAFAFLLGSLFASKESKFNEGDIWRWIAFVMNLPIEHVDRSHLPIMFGILRTTGFRLSQGYGKQFKKMAELLKGPYLESLNDKFGKNPYLKSYITQLREVIKNL